MKQMFALWLLGAVPLAADPILSGNWSIEAEPLEDQRARLEACWRQANEDQSVWRAALDDQKLQLGTQQQIGPLQGEVSVEQQWQEDLQSRRAQVSLSLPDLDGWDTGIAGQWDYSPDQDRWQPPHLRGWLAAPKWRGWTARGEIAHDPSATRLTGRVCRQVGGGQLVFEAEQIQSQLTQRRWLTRYQWELARQARVSAQGGRRWSERQGDYQDELEAKLEIQF